MKASCSLSKCLITLLEVSKKLLEFLKRRQTANDYLSSVSVIQHTSHPSRLHVTCKCDENTSTNSPKSLITGLNRVGLRTENNPLKKLFCKGTPVGILHVPCSPPATNAPNYFSFQSLGLYLVYGTRWHILSRALGKVRFPSSLTACLTSLTKVEIQVVGLDPPSVHSELSSLSKMHPDLEEFP